jgi:hypothetical protein
MFRARNIGRKPNPMSMLRIIWLRALLILTVMVGTVGASLAHQPPVLDAKAYYIGPDGLPGVFCLTGDDPEGQPIGHPCDACLLIGAVDLPPVTMGPVQQQVAMAAPFPRLAERRVAAQTHPTCLPRGPPVHA